MRIVQLARNSVVSGVIEAESIRFLLRGNSKKYLAKGKDVFWTFRDLERPTIGLTGRRCGGCCVYMEWAEIC